MPVNISASAESITPKIYDPSTPTRTISTPTLSNLDMEHDLTPQTCIETLSAHLAFGITAQKP